MDSNLSLKQDTEPEAQDVDVSQNILMKVEEVIYKTCFASRSIRRKTAKQLKIPWDLYVQVEKKIVETKLTQNEKCPTYILKKFNLLKKKEQK